MSPFTRTVRRILAAVVILFASSGYAVAGPILMDIERLPDIRAARPDREYRLVWYNHFNSETLFDVRRTDPRILRMSNKQFESWCEPLDVAGYRMTGKLLVAADEEFKIDYDTWVEGQQLPQLIKRWFEILDDERWYIVELSKR